MNKWMAVKFPIPSNKWLFLTDGERIWLGGFNNYPPQKFYCKCCLDNLENVTHFMIAPEPPKETDANQDT